MSPDENDNIDIGRRTVSGSLYSIGASGVTLSLGLLRAIVMARLLLPEEFGVATLALFYVNLVAIWHNLGIDNALIHHEDADQKTLGTYFTMRLGLILLSLAVLAGATPFLGRLHPNMPLLAPVLYAFVGVSLVKGLNSVQMTMLSKELAFRELAITDVLSSLTMTIVGPWLAWQGYGVWSIVGERLSGLLVRGISIWLLFPVWRPRLGWDEEIARWFWNYGSKLWVGNNLAFFLDRLDDWWTGSFLGSSPLGYYSRAYEFAGYPRRVVGNPLLSVFFPTFARLQADRLRLSRAFFRLASLMVRAGVFLSLVLVLTAPEFIPFLLGEKWLPMVVPFQLMVIYTLFDPLMTAASNLLAATGHPGVIARTRVLQLIAFAPAVFILGTLWGISGVAIAADLMIITGTVVLFRNTRRVVDYSQRTLWFWPLLAMLLCITAVLLLTPVWSAWSAWATAAAKLLTVAILYLAVLWIAERNQLLNGLDMLRNLRRRATSTS
jgi:O-antigen/teichoic acid export membrane protein